MARISGDVFQQYIELTESKVVAQAGPFPFSVTLEVTDMKAAEGLCVNLKENDSETHTFWKKGERCVVDPGRALQFHLHANNPVEARTSFETHVVIEISKRV